MRIVVAIASVGRAELLCKTVDRLADQVRQPDGIYLSVTSSADVAGIHEARVQPQILLAPKGLCAQRNAVLDTIGNSADVIVFFDDDFVPANDYLLEVEKLMTRDPAAVGLTGDLLADGIHGEPIDFADAVAMVDGSSRASGPVRTRRALYGCNMAISLSATGDLRFDENLPLYAWQEDIDFTYQLGQRGKLLSGPQLTGIHLGTRRSRQPGKKLGYSQVANIIYLKKKGTMQPGLGRKLLWQNIVSNAFRSIWPDPGIDRRGRLAGNILAIADWIRGEVDPRKINNL
jgi:hypothetical protein